MLTRKTSSCGTLPARRRLPPAGTLVLTAALSLCIGWLPQAGGMAPALAAPAEPAVEAVVPAASSFADLAEKVAPSVVNLTVSRKLEGVRFRVPSPFGSGDPFGEFFRQFEQMPSVPQQQGVGTGFIISEDGYILTNNHVVQDSEEISVRLLDDRELRGKVVGRDPKTDLALVKVESDTPLPAARLGDSNTARVGEWVVAVGNPYGLNHTVTAGIVSAKGRTLEGPYDDFIQTDASINPGNSGGPLLNMKGEVIGINAQIVAGGQGLGFAVPVNLAKQIVPLLQTSGRFDRGWVGVSIQDLTPEMASHFGIEGKKGALVADVTPDGPAGKAGVRRGDVIVEYQKKPINESHDLPILVAATPVGREVSIKVLRSGAEQAMNVKIGRLEEEGEAASVAAAEGGSAGKLGLAVRELTPEIAKRLEVELGEGVVVAQVAPGSPAAEAGIRPGDLILEVNKKPVKDPASFSAALGRRGDESVLVLIERGGQSLYMAVKRGDEKRG